MCAKVTCAHSARKASHVCADMWWCDQVRVHCGSCMLWQAWAGLRALAHCQSSATLWMEYMPCCPNIGELSVQSGTCCLCQPATVVRHCHLQDICSSNCTIKGFHGCSIPNFCMDIAQLATWQLHALQNDRFAKNSTISMQSRESSCL